MILFDSHCHIDDKSYDKDIKDVISRAESAGVKSSMIVGVGVKSSEKSVKIAETYGELYASVGIHPHDAKSINSQDLTMLAELSKSPKVKAFGEIGLDFNRMFSPQDVQEKWFLEQLELADTLDLPLIYHERDTNGRFLELLKENHRDGRKGVVHCFSGNLDEMTQYLELGLCIGITGIVTIQKRGEELRKLVPLIPSDRILIETDAPYLTPAPEKNKVRRNEPAFVKSTLLKVAEVRGESPEKLSEIIWNNTTKLFNI